MKTTKFQIEKETEKAINVSIKIVTGSMGKEIMWKFWLPKSQIKLNKDALKVPQWLIGPKTMDIRGFVDFA